VNWGHSPFGKALTRLEPETAHRISILALSTRLVRAGAIPADDRLRVNLAGLSFPNPVGLAAGYDKDGEVPDAVLALGFGHVEVGTVTPLPQPGNPRPRIFRLPEHAGVINRLGFNSGGHARIVERLEKRAGRPGIVGVNIGANRQTPDMLADYEAGLRVFWNSARYLTINISSPNTPGLRDLQAFGQLTALLKRIDATRAELVGSASLDRPVFLKIAPDLDLPDLDAIAEAVTASTVDGLIVSNTTTSRDGVSTHRLAAEAGGLSGKPLFARSTAILARMRLRLGPQFPIIGAGGVFGTDDVVGKIEAGADLVQLYTGFIYQGPTIARTILTGLIDRMNRDGLQDISQLKGRKTGEWASARLPGEEGR
jgi:dihydroorotate dehydrogenase